MGFSIIIRSLALQYKLPTAKLVIQWRNLVTIYNLDIWNKRAGRKQKSINSQANTIH